MVSVGNNGTATYRATPSERGNTVISRLVASAARAFLVALLIATPTVLLPQVSDDTSQMVALLSLLAAALTFVEYSSQYPSLVEFRDAKPFNITGDGYVWIVTEQALLPASTPIGQFFCFCSIYFAVHFY